MRKLILQEFVSLDGRAAGSQGSVEFIPVSTKGDRSFGREQTALMDETDTLLLGRVTYELFVAFWPNVTEGEEKEFADKFNELDKVVFSKTLEHAPWGTWGAARIVRDGVVEEVKRLKRQEGRALLLSGSLSLAQPLIEQGLVDEVRLVMCPVVLGKGRALFRDDAEPVPLELTHAHALDRGAVSLVYRPRSR